MYKIQTNASGTRHIDINEKHLETIRHYSLFANLIDSSGVINEDMLDRLRLKTRGLLESDISKDNSLLDLCLDVIYNPDMKALGLKNLLTLFHEWELTNKEVKE
nr:hypothetical protein [uncultured Prevotella sp.]